MKESKSALSGPSGGGKRQDPYYQAQDILSRRDHAEAEVRRKLARKGFSLAQIDEAVDELKAHKLLNDAQFARLYVTNTLRFKAVGPRWLWAKLKEKGVADGLIETAIADALGSEEEMAVLRRARDQWRASHAKHKDDRDRLRRFLLSRGFSPGRVSESIAAESDTNLT